MQRLEVSGVVRHIYASLGFKGLNKFLGAQYDFSQSEERLCNTTGDPEQINDPHDHAEVKEKVKCNTASP